MKSENLICTFLFPHLISILFLYNLQLTHPQPLKTFYHKQTTSIFFIPWTWRQWQVIKKKHVKWKVERQMRQVKWRCCWWSWLNQDAICLHLHPHFFIIWVSKVFWEDDEASMALKRKVDKVQVQMQINEELESWLPPPFAIEHHIFIQRRE